MLPGFAVHRDFFPDAESLRARFEAHFANPHQHRLETTIVVRGYIAKGLFHVDGALAPGQVEGALGGIVDQLAVCVRKVGAGLSRTVNLRLDVGGRRHRQRRPDAL